MAIPFSALLRAIALSRVVVIVDLIGKPAERVLVGDEDRKGAIVERDRLRPCAPVRVNYLSRAASAE